MMVVQNHHDRSFWSDYGPILLVCAAVVGVSLLVGGNRYFQRIILLILIWASACSSFNIISGYGGQIVFGYMMFVGTGAYTTVLLFRYFHLTPWVGMWVGALISALVALIIGLPTLRLRGAYFAVATVAFPLMTIPILNYLGLEEVSIPFVRRASAMQFVDIRAYVVIAAVFLAGVMLVVRKIERSRFGFYLLAIKQNETAAESMGIPSLQVKLLAFMLSAALAALMGTIYAFGVQYMLSTHSAFGLFIIVKVLSISILGGLGTLWGPFLGAALLIPLGEMLSAYLGDRYPGVQDIVYGAALVAAIIFMPEGIWRRVLEIHKKAMGWVIGKGPERGKLLPGPYVCSPILENLNLEPVQQGEGSKTILSLKNVHKAFGGVIPLADISMEVPRGIVLGIIGPNGAGKTTLFNVVNGYLRPNRGNVFFKGDDITNLKPNQICRKGMGRTFQTAQVFVNLTVLENIMIGAFARDRSITRARSTALKLAEQMGLLSRADEQAVGLSMIEIKHLEFSRALATRPELLLVDEPMAGLNSEEADQIGSLIRAIADSGVTVIVIEHFIQNLVKIADWMIGLDGGLKVASGTPQEVTSDPYIIEAYLGSKWRERNAKG